MAQREVREQLHQAHTRAQVLKEQYDNALTEVHVAIASALRAGVRAAEITEITGYHPEHVRRIRAAAGIPPATRGPARRRQGNPARGWE